MQNTKSTITLFFSLLVISFHGVCQNNTSSPYSRFGIGELASPGFGRNKAMGGVGIALRSSRTLNNINPASYTAMDSMSFILEFGTKAKFSKFETRAQENSQKNSNLNFDYLGFAFPITRWWATSFGVMPISDVGYEFRQIETNEEIGGDILFDYSGSGGLNSAYWSNGFNIHKNLSVGIGLSYVFGSIEINRSAIIFQQQPTSDTTFVTIIPSKIEFLEESKIQDAMMNLGLQYQGKLNSQYDYILGFIFRNKTGLSADKTRLTLNTVARGNVSSIDTLENQPEKRTIDLPKTYGIGFAVIKDKKMTFAFDYKHQNWSSARSLGETDTLTNSNKFAFGMEYTPNAGSLRGYFKRVTYRLGGHYSNSYLKIRGEQLKDYGISFGAGFPLRKSSTYITVAVELGKRGTLTNNLIKENYGRISVNFSLFEHWFVKRKFD